jgi:hypothetical protein
MEGRWVVLGSEEGVLGQEPPQLGIEVAGLCVVEAGLLIPDVSGEREAIFRAVQLAGESEVAPGILGNPKTPLPHDETPTIGSRGAGFTGGGAPLRFPMSPRT